MVPSTTLVVWPRAGQTGSTTLGSESTQRRLLSLSKADRLASEALPDSDTGLTGLLAFFKRKSEAFGGHAPWSKDSYRRLVEVEPGAKLQIQSYCCPPPKGQHLDIYEGTGPTSVFAQGVARLADATVFPFDPISCGADDDDPSCRDLDRDLRNAGKQEARAALRLIGLILEAKDCKVTSVVVFGKIANSLFSESFLEEVFGTETRLFLDVTHPGWLRHVSASDSAKLTKVGWLVFLTAAGLSDEEQGEAGVEAKWTALLSSVGPLKRFSALRLRFADFWERVGQVDQEAWEVPTLEGLKELADSADYKTWCDIERPDLGIKDELLHRALVYRFGFKDLGTRGSGSRSPHPHMCYVLDLAMSEAERQQVLSKPMNEILDIIVACYTTFPKYLLELCLENSEGSSTPNQRVPALDDIAVPGNLQDIIACAKGKKTYTDYNGFPFEVHCRKCGRTMTSSQWWCGFPHQFQHKTPQGLECTPAFPTHPVLKQLSVGQSTRTSVPRFISRMAEVLGRQ